MSQIRDRIYAANEPLIVRHAHEEGGHYAVIRDAYHFDGKDYLVIADSKSSDPSNPALGVNWVVEYVEYVDLDHSRHPTWWPSQMIYGFSL